jgi:hypothetical protein
VRQRSLTVSGIGAPVIMANTLQGALDFLKPVLGNRLHKTAIAGRNSRSRFCRAGPKDAGLGPAAARGSLFAPRSHGTATAR